ncbi:MAG: hypothetical protein IKB07_02470 [Lachnospiraceae bacterium]|nr:hypothetical protein [Lachnospiraceae bacterium]
MNIFLNEFYKVWGKKTILGLLILLGILNVVAMFYAESQKGKLYEPQEYRALYEELQSYDREDVEDVLRDRLEKYAGNFKEDALTKTVLSEVQAATGYDSFLEEIAKSAESIGKVSIFSKTDSYTFRSNRETAEAYRDIFGVEPEIGPFQGIEVWAGFMGTDVIALVLLIYVVFILVVKEKETGQLSLTFTTKNGRTMHGAVKLGVCFMSAVGVVFFLWGTGLLVTGTVYGWGESGSAIQSVYTFRTCTLKISVGSFIVLFLLLKIIALFLVMLLVYGLACVFRSYVWLYIVTALGLGIEFVMFYGIPANGHLVFFKQINLMAFLGIDRTLGTYFNFNFLGHPVWYLPVYGAFLLVGIACLFVFCAIQYGKQRSMVEQKKYRFVLWKRRPEKSVYLLPHEGYKTLFAGKVLWILLAVAIFQCVTYKSMGEYFESQDDIYYKNYMTELEGMYSDEQETWLRQERERYDESFLTGKLYRPESYVAFCRVEEQAAYLKEQQGAFLYDTGYRLLTNDKMASGKVVSLTVVANLILILCVTGIYSNEYQSGMIALVKSSVRGRKDTFFVKAFIGLLISLVIWSLIFLPFIYNVLSAYGTSGLEFPACSMKHLSGVGISIKWYLILFYGILYLLLALESFAIMGLSKVMKSNSLTALVSVGIFVMPLLFLF